MANEQSLIYTNKLVEIFFLCLTVCLSASPARRQAERILKDVLLADS